MSNLFESPPFWMYLVGFLLVLGPLITVHELGHYLVGRWFGVKADAFSIGFGKEIFGWTDRRGTRWKLAAIPLGGYVQFKGDMNPASMADPDAPCEPDTFQAQSLGKRALIVFAGPATNILVTLAIFAAFFAVLGRPVPADPADANVIGRFSEESAARDAGAKVGDRIISIGAAPIHTFNDLQEHVLLYPGKSTQLELEREGETFSVPVTIGVAVENDRFGNEQRVGRLGVYSTEYRFEDVALVDALPLAVDQSLGIVRMIVTGLKQIILGERSFRELGGPIKIAKYSGEQLSLGPMAFVNFVALISLNLAFINLLPIPALDGGHLAFYAAEAVRRKPVGLRGQEWAYRTGVALVLMLMVAVTVNDIVSLPFFGS